MGFFNSPKLQYYLRIAQLAFAVAFLVVISYAGVHRGWWRNINAALAVGVIVTVLTFAVTGHQIWDHHRKDPFAGSGRAFFFARLGVDALTLLLWIATAALMLQKKGGCRYRSPPQDGALDLCFDRKVDLGTKYSDRPVTTWNIGVGFTFVEILSFILSFVMVLMGDRASQAKGGA